MSSNIKILPTPIKGKADWRDYKAVELHNGVTVLCIHDKESKTTAMSCIVNVGASSDPREISGLAHFCEHMWYVPCLLSCFSSFFSLFFLRDIVSTKIKTIAFANEIV